MVYSTVHARNLEKYLISNEDLTDEVVAKLPEWAIEELFGQSSGPIGVAYVPDWGYCILASGQGPFVAWSEFDLEKYEAS